MRWLGLGLTANHQPRELLVEDFSELRVAQSVHNGVVHGGGLGEHDGNLRGIRGDVLSGAEFSDQRHDSIWGPGKQKQRDCVEGDLGRFDLGLLILTLTYVLGVQLLGHAYHFLLVVGDRFDDEDVAEEDDEDRDDKAAYVQTEDVGAKVIGSCEIVKRAGRLEAFWDVGAPAKDWGNSPEDRPDPHQHQHKEGAFVTHVPHDGQGLGDN